MTKTSLNSKVDVARYLWIVAGGILGILIDSPLGDKNVLNWFLEESFPKNIAPMFISGLFGMGIAKECPPTRKALVGGLLFPILLVVLLLTTTMKEIIPLIDLYRWIAFGILIGILFGTTWLGSLIGSLLTGMVIFTLAPLDGGIISWQWIVIPFGAVFGAIGQLIFRDFSGYASIKSKQSNPSLTCKDLMTENATRNFEYCEQISSKKTELLFLALTSLFSVLYIWRVNIAHFNILAGVLLFFFALFLFYVVNYRTLRIRISQEALRLRFGIFHMTIPLENIASCGMDELSALQRYGGAGIHFMMVKERYRVFFNFLEYPRVVVRFKHKQGLVRDASFSTRQPESVLSRLQPRP